MQLHHVHCFVFKTQSFMFSVWVYIISCLFYVSYIVYQFHYLPYTLWQVCWPKKKNLLLFWKSYCDSFLFCLPLTLHGLGIVVHCSHYLSQRACQHSHTCESLQTIVCCQGHPVNDFLSKSSCQWLPLKDFLPSFFDN